MSNIIAAAHEPIITIDNAYLTDLELEIVLTMPGETHITNPKITNIISHDSANKLVLKNITTWYQMMGIGMTFRSIDPNTGLIISDNVWFNKICEYFDNCELENPDIVAYAITSYLNARIFI
jgi:hypothetical protein